MTADIIDGKAISAELRVKIRDEINELKSLNKNFNPKLVIIQVGSRPDSSTYVRMKLKACSEVGIDCISENVPEDISQEELLAKIEALNNDDLVHGMLVQLPLPPHLNESIITNSVKQSKDIDGFSQLNLASVFKKNDYPLYLPCTPKGILYLLEHEKVGISHKNIVVCGRSDIVGSPLAKLLEKKGATVTILHSKSTEEQKKFYISNADIVVSAVGQANFITGDFIKTGSTIIDVGTNFVPDATKKSGQRMCGDVDFESCLEKAGKITPVPGGVGPMTVVMILVNVLDSAKKAADFKRLKLNLVKPVPSDFEISRNQTPKHIVDVAKESGILDDEIEPFGSYKAKVKLSLLDRLHARKNGKYILVTGITPTPLGEGKSTTTVGLAQALGASLNKTAFANVRQPSMGPTFGIKGGAAGGGFSQVIPMDEFNMHLTGDIHAIGAANNLLAAALDTRMFHEKTQADKALFRRLCPLNKDGSRNIPKGLIPRIAKLGLDKKPIEEWTDEEIGKYVRLDINPETITWKRVVDVNDRFLRGITIGQAATEKGFTRETGFDITVASECMAILALSNSLVDLRDRLGKMVVASSHAGEPVTCEDLGCAGALTALLKDAIKPNIMQTLEGTPVFVHAGPFANISIGASSVLADKMALKLAGVDPGLTPEEEEEKVGYVVTEAGFDFTMGGERFLNIKCRSSGLKPDVIIIVATVRALKVHGGGSEVKSGQDLPIEYTTENLPMLSKGCANLAKHIENAKQYGVDVIVAINKMSADTAAEHEIIRAESLKAGAIDAIISNHWEEGGAGAVDLAKGVVACANKEYPSQKEREEQFKFLYDLENSSIADKITAIAKKMYGAGEVEFLPQAQEKIKEYTSQGFDNLPICIAKTQYSLSHDAKLKGVPTGFKFPIRDIKASVGAGYLYALAAEIQTIPGLATRCGFMNVEVNEDGEIDGLF
ncbi:hypothetical protein PACTADRAFT_43406 [Pachysolen tannophilus NRRL Y-2460]|uniref:C-1-tetrahydrofolate synthase, cytoplasmic n=1 Tax=Pachysolen tannophilus NRRL Y-2460 TaxID=669874 RepID=A0A1E4TTI1_PACTA|nr:hypothetical protein PACTADRAFT_43406 [Pachysolen tannophilus NRRL Y-2460]